MSAMGMGCPQVNKFEQVSSLGDQMLLTGNGVPVQRSGLWGGGSLGGEVQCNKGNGYMGPHLRLCTDRHT